LGYYSMGFIYYLKLRKDINVSEAPKYDKRKRKIFDLKSNRLSFEKNHFINNFKIA